MDYHFCKQWACSNYYRWRAILPSRLLYHADYFRLRKLLRATREEQEAVAEQRARHIMTAAITFVPFYRRTVRLRHCELDNEPLPDLLEQFPYLSKSEVMESQRDFLDERLDTRWMVYAASHGSSGHGIGVWRNKRQADIEKAFYMHEWGQFGFSFDKSRYVRIGADAARPLDDGPVSISGNRLMLSPDHLRPVHRSAIVLAINAFRPQFIHAYPSAAMALAELLAPGDLKSPLKGVLLASEPAMPPQLALLGETFNCPVSISYGLTERTNLAFARSEQGITTPYQFQSLYAITETRFADGHPEIVGTSLWNDVMPLIRYRTGDFATIDNRGRSESIQGRLQEFVIDRAGNRIPGLSLALHASTWDFVRACQIKQQAPGELTLVVVPRHGVLTDEQKTLLLAAPRQNWGSRFSFKVDEVTEIAPAPGGKRRFVVNELLGSAG